MQNAHLSQPPLVREAVAEQQSAMGEAQHVNLASSPRLRLFAVCINLLVILELCIAMYMASLDQSRLTPIFFKVFFSMLVPTLIGAAVGRRLIARSER